jgi:hypothetical protein
MIQALSGIATAFGLAGSAGLNAYLPLLMVALAARFTKFITLSPPFDLLTDNVVIGVLGILLVIETFADKIAVVDTINDAIQTFVRPVAGAILFAASANVITEVNPVLAMVCGLILAFGVHSVKATARPVFTATTGGLANPLVSLAEDVVSVIVSFMAIVMPLVGALLLVIAVAAFLLWLRGRRRKKT